MMLYSKSTNGFYVLSVHGDSVPADAVEITKSQHAALLAAQSAGKSITSDANGHPIAVDRPTDSGAQLLGIVKSEMRALRRDMLDAVTGIGFRANVAGNTTLAQEAAQVSQQLLDITNDPGLNAAQTYDDMRNAGMDAYRRIADSVSPDLRSAFKELEK